MKMYTIAPHSPTQDNFAPSDNMVDYAVSQGKRVRGHTLIWYNGAPSWIAGCRDKQTLLRFIGDYVTRVVKHYGNKVYSWDVVNEAIGDDNRYRSAFYDVAGIDYIETAFCVARAANPHIRLFYNDYNLDKPQKRAKVIEMLRELQRDGVPVDGVGMQGHYNLKDTRISDVENAIREFSALGLEVQITELDVKITAIRAHGGRRSCTVNCSRCSANMRTSSRGLRSGMRQTTIRGWTETIFPITEQGKPIPHSLTKITAGKRHFIKFSTFDFRLRQRFCRQKGIVTAARAAGIRVRRQ